MNETRWSVKWDYIHRGARLLINGYCWTVTARDGATFSLNCPPLATTRDGLVDLTKDVMVLGQDDPKYLMQDELVWHGSFTDVEELIRTSLGGVMLATKMPGVPVFTIPAEAMTTPDLIRTHLIVAHGFSSQCVGDSLLAHALDTTPTIPHVHERTTDASQADT